MQLISTVQMSCAGRCELAISPLNAQQTDAVGTMNACRLPECASVTTSWTIATTCESLCFINYGPDGGV